MKKFLCVLRVVLLILVGGALAIGLLDPDIREKMFAKD